MVCLAVLMKTSLDHLPAGKREPIAAIASLLQASAPVEMILLFGSYARGDWVEDPVTGYTSDFDVLAIVASEEAEADHALWARLEAEAREIAGRVPVSLLVHSIKHVNQEIRTGQYFFGDIVNEGILLFESRRVQLAKPKALNAAERLSLAERNLGYWFESASGFFQGSIYYSARRMQAHAAFLLHQAAERYFHAALLVFTGYKPKTHDLERLANQTAPLHSALSGALPRAEPEDERLFKLLKRAYIDARYSKSYRVTDEELCILRARVRDLGARVREACAEKLASFCGAEAVGELPEAPREEGAMELPEPPALDDPAAVERWQEAIAAMSFERGEAAGYERGRLETLRAAIRRVFARRKLSLSTEMSARIDTCADLAVLERWLEEAAVAETVEEALR
ncbi:MAG: HEPN domain-containing protein [Polyangiaceae bacterium]|nr:HEPN domain-containing protein [Polyangiaceae bacterium]NUQ76338.1 HEPN domain-containing protein [Polyangiaceae bacterium]